MLRENNDYNLQIYICRLCGRQIEPGRVSVFYRNGVRMFRCAGHCANEWRPYRTQWEGRRE